MKLLLTILLFLMSIGFVVENFLLPDFKVASQLLQEEDLEKSAEEETENKKGDDIKVKWHFIDTASLPANASLKSLASAHLYLLYSTGYLNRPYTPPDMI